MIVVLWSPSYLYPAAEEIRDPESNPQIMSTHFSHLPLLQPLQSKCIFPHGKIQHSFSCTLAYSFTLTLTSSCSLRVLSEGDEEPLPPSSGLPLPSNPQDWSFSENIQLDIVPCINVHTYIYMCAHVCVLGVRRNGSDVMSEFSGPLAKYH